jgi:hypothetical protein
MSIGIAFAVLVMLDHHFFGSVRMSWPGIVILAAIFTFLTCWMAGFLWFGLQLGAEVERPVRRWPNIALLAVGLLATWPVSLLAMFVLASASWRPITMPLGISLTGAIFLSIVGIAFGILHQRETNYRREWAELDLNVR